MVEFRLAFNSENLLPLRPPSRKIYSKQFATQVQRRRGPEIHAESRRGEGNHYWCSAKCNKLLIATIWIPCRSFSFKLLSRSPALSLTRPKKSAEACNQRNNPQWKKYQQVPRYATKDSVYHFKFPREFKTSKQRLGAGARSYVK